MVLTGSVRGTGDMRAADRARRNAEA